MKKIIKKLKHQKSTIESQGHKVAYICLYGSQNYGLDIYTDDYQSDLDMKAILIPTLDDLINNNKPISTVIETEWGECDLKDIRSYFETLLKGNPAYLETLFTKYYIVDDGFETEFKEILSFKDDLVHTLRAQMIRAMYGMMLEKEKALCHPYPSIAHKIEKFGYDGKQAHHVLRMWLMMKDYFKFKKPLSDCFYPSSEYKQSLINLKLSIPSLDYVKNNVQEIMTKANHLRDEVIESTNENTFDYSIKNDFINLSRKIIKDKIIKDIRG
jgi:predicted nucleotidyltransferase